MSEVKGKPQRGRQGELVAERFLRSHGYKIIERNYSTPMGEIDLVALDGKSVVFVEVRSRSSSDFGSPSETVTRRKQVKIARAAGAYAARRHLGNVVTRFDVVAVRWPEEEGEPEIELTKGAFESPI